MSVPLEELRARRLAHIEERERREREEREEHERREDELCDAFQNEALIEDSSCAPDGLQQSPDGLEQQLGPGVPAAVPAAVHTESTGGLELVPVVRKAGNQFDMGHAISSLLSQVGQPSNGRNSEPTIIICFNNQPGVVQHPGMMRSEATRLTRSPSPDVVIVEPPQDSRSGSSAAMSAPPNQPDSWEPTPRFRSPSPDLSVGRARSPSPYSERRSATPDCVVSRRRSPSPDLFVPRRRLRSPSPAATRTRESASATSSSRGHSSRLPREPSPEQDFFRRPTRGQSLASAWSREDASAATGSGAGPRSRLSLSLDRSPGCTFPNSRGETSTSYESSALTTNSRTSHDFSFLRPTAFNSTTSSSDGQTERSLSPHFQQPSTSQASTEIQIVACTKGFSDDGASSSLADIVTTEPGLNPSPPTQQVPAQKGIRLECSICLGVVVGVFTSTPCGHVFHLICIKKWFKSNGSAGSIFRCCPLCKKKFTPSALGNLKL
ncbi:serine/arginine repetitive matrix protein 1-like [Thrips palmi]|uniref:Serine/arginine repetitive matrix protein 1-like n=1 Tax=Thrips palmi TaxID=161013 RepID=A0A6P8YCA0_THRPL|nr:serine/arginine repetitive matrix protein 1-like [Thrips palmi]